MTTIRGLTVFRRPVEEVFDFIADPRNEPSYNSVVVEADKTTPGPIGTGTRYVQRLKSLGGTRPAEIELSAYDRPRQLGWHVASTGMDVTGDEHFRSLPDGRTEVSWRWEFSPRGWLRALGPLVGAAGARLEHRVWRHMQAHLDGDQATDAGAATPTGEIAPGVFCIGPHGRTLTNVYLVRTAAGAVLLDAGWAKDADRIADAVRRVVGEETPTAIVLTHAHPDHSGAARELVLRWGCPVYLHAAEVPIATGDFDAMVGVAGPLDRWVVLPILRLMGPRRREKAIAAGSLAGLTRILSPGVPLDVLPGWDVVATPGHTPGHVSFFRPADGVLLSGDALVTVPLNNPLGLLRRRHELSGPPWYTTWNRDRAAASIRTLESLRPRLVAGGHGYPLVDPVAWPDPPPSRDRTTA
jgi:glyoxylase-like metal-dependent hydrolase (beta-lactamase superfamily II)